MKRKIAIWNIVAILAGILPSGNVPAGASAAKADGTGTGPGRVWIT